jgi:menaquinone-dependent protoporphyrinogen IX oxidase
MKMNTLVAYYTRSGNTKTIGETISKELSSALDEIIDKKKRKGKIGWLRSGKDAAQEKMTEIEIQENPGNYELIIIGTPVWAGNMTPAVRTYLTNYASDLDGKKLAFFVTSGGSEGGEKALEKLEYLAKQLVPSLEIVAKLSVLDKEIKSELYSEKVQSFLKSF